MIDSLFPKIHKEGYKFLAISIIVTFFIWLFFGNLSLIFILITFWVYYFFRDPERISISDNNYFVSPADGIVSMITEIQGPIELGLENTKYTRISIFMNVFNCHVNRSPVAGTIDEIFYKPGKFLNASLDKASEENERNYYKINTTNNEEIIVVQIAGLIARRIVSDVSKSQKLAQGDRLGIIRFGSRVDLYLKNKKILVKPGQNVIAGESLLAQNESGK